MIERGEIRRGVSSRTILDFILSYVVRFSGDLRNAFAETAKLAVINSST